MFWRRSVGRFKSDRPVRACVDIKSVNCISLFLVCLRQSSHVVLGFLHWGFLQLHPENRITVNQSTCVCNKEEVLGWWVTWLVLDSDGLGEAGADFLMTRLVIIFLFLVKTRGATIAEACLRLEADWSKSDWIVIFTFFIDGDPLQKSTSGAVGRKWNGSLFLVIGSGPSCCY